MRWHDRGEKEEGKEKTKVGKLECVSGESLNKREREREREGQRERGKGEEGESEVKLRDDSIVKTAGMER